MTGLKTTKNTAITIFGGTGDLTYRKLIPGLYNLHAIGKLKENFKIIIPGRRNYTTSKYIEIIKPWIEKYSRKKVTEELFNEFSKRISYFKMNIPETEDYKKLQDFYKKKDIEEHIYYYAVAPAMFLKITKGIKTYLRENKAKVIIEKPFGENLEDATKLNEELSTFFDKNNIFHIDHYLGKEMIQNILSVRFNNAIFKNIWNKDIIESVQITASETVGVESRASYYDKSGAVRDMLQNHLLQVLSIVAMEEPKGDMKKEQLNLLKAIKPCENIEESLILGQYEGYLKEENVSKNSKTETYVALKLEIDNERWKGVPFFIRTGKRMLTRETQVVIKFKSENKAPQNMLVIKIQPTEGIYLKFNVKKPGSVNTLKEVSMDFCQSCILESKINTPEAYERLLYAALKGNKMLFSKWEHIVTSWNYIDDLMKKYKESSSKLYTYPQDSMGPVETNRLTDWILD